MKQPIDFVLSKIICIVLPVTRCFIDIHTNTINIDRQSVIVNKIQTSNILTLFIYFSFNINVDWIADQRKYWIERIFRII